MSEKYWRDDDTSEELDPIGSLLSEWSDPEEEEEEWRSDFFQGLAGRRRKAAFLLFTIWTVTIGLHLVAWGTWIILTLTGVISVQLLRILRAKPTLLQPNIILDEYPTVSLLVAAKNEEAVISRLINQLGNLDYPQDNYEIWIIDDHSTDKTPMILDELAEQYPQVKVIHRHQASTGGKSGALNELLTLSQGSIIGVFDADAQITSDLLLKVVPMFKQEKMGAVQLRKSIVNAETNFLTKGQSAEMALDSFYQQQRVSCGGLGELRGNGQFVLRLALDSCGGWNEETITDDLDLTIRLHLDDWKIGFCLEPKVEEEGVTSTVGLWHQRNRWAEGGYQRYLDYWRLLLSQPMGFKKKLDLLTFLFIQYIIPTAAVPDLLMTIVRHHSPLLTPLTGVIFSFSFLGMYKGLGRTSGQTPSLGHTLQLLGKTIGGMVYMIHWFIVIPSITTRLSIRPKTLKWVKTSHIGEDQLTLLSEGESQT